MAKEKYRQLGKKMLFKGLNIEAISEDVKNLFP